MPSSKGKSYLRHPRPEALAEMETSSDSLLFLSLSIYMYISLSVYLTCCREVRLIFPSLSSSSPSRSSSLLSTCEEYMLCEKKKIPARDSLSIYLSLSLSLFLSLSLSMYDLIPRLHKGKEYLEGIPKKELRQERQPPSNGQIN